MRISRLSGQTGNVPVAEDAESLRVLHGSTGRIHIPGSSHKKVISHCLFRDPQSFSMTVGWKSIKKCSPARYWYNLFVRVCILATKFSLAHGVDTYTENMQNAYCSLKFLFLVKVFHRLSF